MKIVTGEKQKHLTLKDIQGISFFKRSYTAETVEDYANELKRMDLADMQAHAARRDVVPLGARARLEKNLLKAFERAKLAFDMANRGLTSGSVIDHGISQEKRERALEQGKRYR